MSDKRLTPAVLASLFADVFETDARGRTLLVHLILMFGRPAVRKGGIDAILETYYRSGQRDLLDYIDNQIELAHQAGAKPTETPLAKTE